MHAGDIIEGKMEQYAVRDKCNKDRKTSEHRSEGMKAVSHWMFQEGISGKLIFLQKAEENEESRSLGKRQ